MTTAAPDALPARGDTFLLEESSPGEVYTAEDLSEEHLAIARTVHQFWMTEVEPQLEAIRQQRPGVALAMLRKSAEIFQPRT